MEGVQKLDKKLLGILLIPFIGALIGWVTNVLAIKLIFRPFNPIRVPIVGYNIQGIIPKRRDQIIKTIAEVVENELISLEDFVYISEKPGFKEELKTTITKSISKRILSKMPVFIPTSIVALINNYFQDIINREFDVLYKSLIKEIINKAQNSISIKKIVQQKLEGFKLEELEDLIINISKRELKHIEMIGGLIGFVIGVFQAMYFYFFK